MCLDRLALLADEAFERRDTVLLLGTGRGEFIVPARCPLDLLADGSRVALKPRDVGLQTVGLGLFPGERPAVLGEFARDAIAVGLHARRRRVETLEFGAFGIELGRDRGEFGLEFGELGVVADQAHALLGSRGPGVGPAHAVKHFAAARDEADAGTRCERAGREHEGRVEILDQIGVGEQSIEHRFRVGGGFAVRALGRGRDRGRP